VWENGRRSFSFYQLIDRGFHRFSISQAVLTLLRKRVSIQIDYIPGLFVSMERAISMDLLQNSISIQSESHVGPELFAHVDAEQ